MCFGASGRWLGSFFSPVTLERQLIWLCFIFFWWFLKDFTLSSFVYEKALLPIPLVAPPPRHTHNRVVTWKGGPRWISYLSETMGSYTLLTKQNKMLPISVIYRHITPWLLMGGGVLLSHGSPKTPSICSQALKKHGLSHFQVNPIWV